MLILLRCTNGHFWKVDADDTLPPCPECGQNGRIDESVEGSSGTELLGSQSTAAPSINDTLPPPSVHSKTSFVSKPSPAAKPANGGVTPAPDTTLPGSSANLTGSSHPPDANDQTLAGNSAQQLAQKASSLADDKTLNDLPGFVQPKSPPSNEHTLAGSVDSRARAFGSGTQRPAAEDTNSITNPHDQTLVKDSRPATGQMGGGNQDHTLDSPTGSRPTRERIESPTSFGMGTGPRPTSGTIPAMQSGSNALAGYDIMEVLGRGGMGIVYKARQIKLNRVVALKMILSGGHASGEDLARFQAEAQAVAKMQHPNILQIYEVSEADGRPFFSLEYLDGGTLQKKMDRSPMPAKLAASIMETCSRAIHYAHRKGVLHRDIKPANILLASDGTPKISDFGLAKPLDRGESLNPSHSVVGTPMYMSPEQAIGKDDIGPAADVYSLGATLYEMLIGRPPFRGATVLDTLRQVQEVEPVPPRQLQPTVPLDLQTICLKCLHKDPRKRYPSAEAFADDLRNFLDDKPIQARPVSGTEKAWKWSKRHPAAAGLILVSCISIIGLIIGGFTLAAVERQRADKEAALSEEVRKERDKAIHERKIARERGDEALKNFQRAQEAVEVLVRLAQNRLTNERHLETVGRELLEKALVFYERFLTQKPSDPVMRLQVARAQLLAGDLREKLARYSQAEDAYAAAEKMFLDLIKDDPEKINVYRRELASVWIQKTTVLQVLRKFDEADETFQRAIDLLDRLPTDSPHDLISEWLVGAGCHNRGMFLYQRGQIKDAESAYLQAIRTFERLTADYPDLPAPKVEMGRVKTNLALLHTLPPPGNPPLAEKYYQDAIDTMAPIVEKFADVPAYRKELGRTYLNRGVLRTNQGNFDQAEKDELQASVIFEDLALNFPGVADYRHLAATTSRNLGDLYARQNKIKESAIAFQRGVTLMEKLVKDEPKAAHYNEDLAKLLTGLGQSELQQLPDAKTAGALSADQKTLALKGEGDLERSLSFWKKLVDEYPQELRYRVELASAYEAVGDAYKQFAALTRKTSPNDAIAALKKYVSLRQEIVKKFPESSAFQDNLASAWLTLGVIQAGAGLYAETAKTIDDLLPQVKPDWKHYFVIGQTLAQCAAAADKDAKLDATEKEKLVKQYGDRAIAILNDARQAGWNGQAFLQQHPSLQFLRDNPAFKDAFAKLAGNP